MSNTPSKEDVTTTLMCGGRKCCPRVTRHADGSATLSDTDGPVPQTIHLNPEQAAMLVAALSERT